MAAFNHQLKRLQHPINSFDSRSALPQEEAIRESIQNFTFSSHNTNYSRSFTPGPNQARRGGGGGGGRGRDYSWCSSISLPKRAINYDLAESFVDHSTNPLSSDLYKIRLKHSHKQWPNGRFMNYAEKLYKVDGTTVGVTCTRTFPLVPKRKMTKDTEKNTTDSISSFVPVDPVVQEKKKKLADKQTDFYAKFFGVGKIPRLTSTGQIKKIDCADNSTTSSTSMVLLGENKE